MTVALWWIRRDLRLSDNQALAAALARADQVVPVYVLDPELLSAPTAGPKRVAFLFEGLRRLDADLRAKGSWLTVRRGEPAHELHRLARETGAQAVFAEEDYWPYARQRDARVGAALQLILTGGLTVHHPDAVVKGNGAPYTVFTPFGRAWKGLPLPEARSVIPTPTWLPSPPEVDSLPIPAEPAMISSVPFPAGEAEGQRRLQRFTDWGDPVVYGYAQGRDRMDQDATSKLSPYLRFGMVSARQAVVGALGAIESAPDEHSRRGAEVWLNELIWREFYMAILHHYPDVETESFRQELRQIAWENDESAFAAWCSGQTGYPIVDAAMRQLVETGWMHNRARMIVASFLVKDLLIDWRWGERFFMEHLVDGDPAANNGGWQWTAGTGTDAAPYFRIFNPVLQSKKYDPEGTYIRRWVPELASVPAEYIHAPWDMPSQVRSQAGFVIGQNYPAPIIDHDWARGRVLAAYGQARAIGSPSRNSANELERMT
jgi:deoxyribodipyrimidine photo-lyase